MKQELPDIALADLLARVRTDGECLEWTGYAQDGRFPQWRIQYRLWSVRMLLWLVTRGAVKPRCQVGVSCDNELCVHPDHLIQRTKSTQLRGKRLAPDRIVRVSLGRRAGSVLDMAKVREIRTSDEPIAALAARHGISRSHVHRIRRHEHWVEHNSPFAGLVARAGA